MKWDIKYNHIRTDIFQMNTYNQWKHVNEKYYKFNSDLKNSSFISDPSLWRIQLTVFQKWNWNLKYTENKNQWEV